jgi:hypothetical protein
MTRKAIVLIVLISAACATDPQCWRGFPLPPDVTVVKEHEEFLGSASILHIAFDKPLLFEEIVAFYEAQLPPSWSRCPSGYFRWPPGRITSPAERAMWVNSEERQFLWAQTAERLNRDEVDNHDVEKLIVLGHDSDATSWELVNRGLCAPRNTELYSTMAIVHSKGRCRSSSKGPTFDPQAWRSADEVTRGPLIDDLICRGLLLGIEQQEVIDLLGPPDTRDNGAFSYRAHLTVDPPFPPPPNGTLECPETEGELRFDFTVEIPSDADATFWLAYECWEDGT